ncbi:hypothetical protein ACLB2K_057785 [Fragaria x ananassa]
MLREERVYPFQGNPTNAPKLLRLFADGSFFHERKVCPSDTDVLEMIGHSRGLVCFKNASMRQILVWDLQRQRVRTIVAEVGEGGESSYGFGHRNGVYMIVRLGRPALFYNRQYFEYHIHTFVEGQQGPWTRFEFRLDAHFNFRTGGTGIWGGWGDSYTAPQEQGKQVLSVDGAAFLAAPAGILAIPSGIAMEVADARKFKATQTSSCRFSHGVESDINCLKSIRAALEDPLDMLSSSMGSLLTMPLKELAPSSLLVSKVNVDGACDSKSKRSGIGVVIRNHQGSCVAEASIFGIRNSAIEFEADTVVCGMKLVKHLGLHSIALESDCLEVFQAQCSKILSP